MASGIVERFVVQLGWDVSPQDQKKLNDFEQGLDGLLIGAAKLTAAFAGLVTAIGGLAAATNRQTAEMNNLAQSVGVSLGFVEALGSEAREIGLNFDNVVDLVEEMNNKLGEKKGLKQMTAVEESLQLLGLRLDEIQEKTPEEQFIRIFDAAKNLQDQQQAVSAVDMLMGGEANKLLGHLRNIDGAMLDIIQRRLELNFLSEEGTQGAIEFSKSLGFVIDSVTSVWREFSGLLGKALLPSLDAFTEWIRANRELIKTRIQEWVDRISRAIQWLIPRVMWLIDKLDKMWDWVEKIIEKLGGFEQALKLVGIFLASAALVRGILLIRKLGDAAVLTQIKMFAWVAIIAAVIVILEDLWVFLTDPEADTMTGRLLEKFREWTGIDLTTPIREAWPRVAEFFEVAWNAIKKFGELVISTFGAVLEFFIDIFTKGIGKAWDLFLIRMKDTWFAVWPEMFKFFDRILVQPLTSAFDWITNKISGFAQAIKNSILNNPIISKIFGSSADAAASTGGQQSTVVSNNQSVGEVSVNVRQTNASPADIRGAVTAGIEAAMSSAVRSNSTQVEY